MRYIMASCPFNSASETIADFIYRYGSQQQFPDDSKNNFCMDFVSTDFSIIYTPLDTVKPISLSKFTYYSIPSLYTLLDSSNIEASGIMATHASPTLSNRGRGVIIGIIDTGIDYTNPLFRNQDGT